MTGHVDGSGRTRIYVGEVDPLGLSAREGQTSESVCEAARSPSCLSRFRFPSGLRAGDEVLAVNGAAVSTLDLDLMQSVFSHQNLQLLLSRDLSPVPEEPGGPWDLYRPPARLDLQTGTAGDASTRLSWSLTAAGVLMILLPSQNRLPPTPWRLQTMLRLLFLMSLPHR